MGTCHTSPLQHFFVDVDMKEVLIPVPESELQAGVGSKGEWVDGWGWRWEEVGTNRVRDRQDVVRES